MTVVGVGAPGTGSTPGPRAQLGFPLILHTVGGGTDPHRHMVQECYTQARPKPQTVEVEEVADQAPWGHRPHGESSVGGGSRCQYSQALAAQLRSLAPNGRHSPGEHFAWETPAARGVTGGEVVLRPLRPTHRPLAGGAPPPPAPALRQSLLVPRTGQVPDAGDRAGAGTQLPAPCVGPGIRLRPGLCVSTITPYKPDSFVPADTMTSGLDPQIPAYQATGNSSSGSPRAPGLAS